LTHWVANVFDRPVNRGLVYASFKGNPACCFGLMLPFGLSDLRQPPLEKHAIILWELFDTLEYRLHGFTHTGIPD
jgi:hypothetical protein